MITKIVIRVFGSVTAFFLFVGVLLLTLIAGSRIGYNNAVLELNQLQEEVTVATIEKGKTEIVYVTPKPEPIKTYPRWGGPELWEAVNKSRVSHGVGPLNQRDELCTIASIRLNQLLALGTLDGHEGFGKLPESRPDLKWIFDKYDISEFLVSGASSQQEAVSLWENTLGHKKLLTGGEYSYGCIYAQSGFGVAIAAY